MYLPHTRGGTFMVKGWGSRVPLKSKMPPQFGASSRTQLRDIILLWLQTTDCIFLTEEKLKGVQRRAMNSSEHGNGVGQPTRAKERAWDTLPGNTKRRREGRGVYKLARDSQGEPRLLAPSHSHSFHKASQVSEQAAKRRGPPLSQSQGEVVLGLSLFLRKGLTWGIEYLWDSKNENTEL